MPGFVTFAALTVLALLLASFGGALHPLGDSLAVFRLGLAVAALALLPGLFAWPRTALAGLILTLAALSGIGASQLGRTPPGPLTVYQKNMWVLNGDLAALEADIRAAAPDIVLLQEVSVRNAALVHALDDAYPNRQVCAQTRDSGIAVLTHLPVTGARFCADDVGLAGLQIDTGGGPLWALSLHLTWPYPLDQAAQVDIVAARLAALTAPVVLGADFNAVPWSHAMRTLTRAADLRRAGPARPSFYLGPVPLPIDHVLAPGGGSNQTRGFHGSDHRGVLARVHPAPPGQAHAKAADLRYFLPAASAKR